MSACTTRLCATCMCPKKFFLTPQSMGLGKVTVLRMPELEVAKNSPFEPQVMPRVVKKRSRRSDASRLSDRFRKSLEILA